MERLPGVESADVRLNEGRASVRLTAGNAVTMADMRRSVTRNGFTPQQAVVHAQAEVVATGGRLQLRISGTNDAYDVAMTAHASGIQQQLEKYAGQRILVDGIVPAPRDAKAVPVMQVTGVGPVAR